MDVLLLDSIQRTRRLFTAQSTNEAVATESARDVNVVMGRGGCRRSPTRMRRRRSAETRHRRPCGTHRWKRRRQRGEILRRVHDLAADDREQRFDRLDLGLGYGEVVLRQHREVSELT